ncbi:MAG: hypothetical protein DHS20C17_11330 [Cyclobacteriaceae bacterium]|nr:MAG: hypothetical protein DHS20C17_11330 [Cyclobacteriaceae bacterium]
MSLFGQEVGIYYTKNGSKLTGDKPHGFKIAYDQGFALGAFVDLRIAPDVLVSLQPGYLKMQSRIKVPDRESLEGGLKDTLDFSLNYFILPVLFKIKPTKSKRFYFIVGPQFGFLLDSKTTNELGDQQDRSNIMNDLNVTLNFGVGYRIPIKFTSLMLEVKYEQGIVNITDFGNPEELFSRVKTQGINMTLLFGLPIGGTKDE